MGRGTQWLRAWRAVPWPEATWRFAKGTPLQGVWVGGTSQDLVIKKRGVFLWLLIIVLLANATVVATQRCVGE